MRDTARALVLLAICAVACDPVPAGAQWTDVTAGPLATLPARVNGVAWGDYDNDGDPDLSLASNYDDFPVPFEFLLRNDGGGVFVDVTSGRIAEFQSGALSTIWGDADNDGDLELYRTFYFQPENEVLRNTGGMFTLACLVSTKGGLGTAAFGDYDLDGLLDLIIVDHNSDPILVRNFGGLNFADWLTPQPPFPAGAERALWVDFDGDRDLDLHLLDHHNYHFLMRNQGGSFVSLGISTSNGDLGGAAWGDYDNDGDPDYYLAQTSGTNHLIRNDGAGVFTDVTAGTPLGFAGDSEGASWVDYDNDGDLDLFVLSRFGANVMFRNDDGVFSATASSALDGVGTRGSAAWADFDGDGDLDVYIATTATQGRLIRNDLGPSHWLHVDLVGSVSNRSGIGARIRVKAGGAWMTRDVSGGDGMSQGSLTAEFGLGSSNLADSVVVLWPSGTVQVRISVADNQRIVIDESQLVGVEDAPPRPARLWPPAPNPARASTRFRLDVATARRLRVEILDLEGRGVRLIADREFEPGAHDLGWDGMDSNGRSAPAGLYMIRAGLGPDRQFQRLVRLR